ncbi:nucleoside phosphorylase [Desulfopila sp. IMCC35008]|uniref:nucleoside phosphorylase n=1 Tax=Desulfopila sp. IMCC35008 TaxID=2653858 RepID=UPI0013D433DF|nr:nucleoside phosphorylase [Desulfopila sp. IMCC35008]
MAETDIIVHPKRGKRENPVPKDGIFFVTPAEARRAHELVEGAGGTRRFFYNSRLTVSGCGSYFVVGPAVGSPMAAMTMEKLIALGAQSIIMYGWCGAADDALHVGDVLVGSVAVSGEGTSKYYPGSMPKSSSGVLSRFLQGWAKEKGLVCTPAVIWTTDAPYRENRVELAELQRKEGVQAVDMEYSALCSVAMFRNIDFAALLLVSDELYHTNWRHGFMQSAFKQTNRQIVELLCSQCYGENAS